MKRERDQLGDLNRDDLRVGLEHVQWLLLDDEQWRRRGINETPAEETGR